MNRNHYRYGIRRTVAPLVEPVTVAEVMADLDIQRTDQEGMVERLIQTAREQIEDQTNRQIITATWQLSLDGFPSGPILIPRCPVQSVGSVTYISSNGTSTTLSSSDYTVVVDDEPAEIHVGYGLSWPSTRDVPRAVVVEFDAGYGDAATDVPAIVKSLLMLIVGGLYEFRESHLADAGVASILEFPGVRAMLDLLRYGEDFHVFARG